MIGAIIRKYSCFFLCFLPFLSVAQQKNIFTIRNVDSAYLVKNTLIEDYDKVFVGNVFLEEKNKQIKFFCDSAYQHADTQLLEVFGEVQVNRGDSIDLQGKYMALDLNTSFLKVRENAVLEHARATLLTDSLDYNLDSEVGAYNYGGKLVDSTSTLRSRIGKYFANNGDAYFEKDVVITGETYTMTTDSLRYNVNTNEVFVIAPTDFQSEEYQMHGRKGVYNTNTGISKFENGTKLINESYVLTGDNLTYNEKTGIGVLTEHCKLVDAVNNMVLNSAYMRSEQRDSTVLAVDDIELQYMMEQDTLFAHSDTIFVHKDSLHNNVLEIFHKVKFFKTDMQGKCDSMSFSSADSIMRMYDNPTLWSGENQLTADTITTEFVEEKLKHINLLQNAFSVSAVDTAQNYYNQLKGRTMRGFIENDTLRKVEAYGNGETLYFMEEKEVAAVFGTIRCSDITIRFKEQKLDEITFKTKPVGSAFPITDAGKESLYLNGFRWDDANRPRKREDIFIWESPKATDELMPKKVVITEEDEEVEEEEKHELKQEEPKEESKKSRKQRRKERREARKNKNK